MNKKWKRASLKSYLWRYGWTRWLLMRVLRCPKELRPIVGSMWQAYWAVRSLPVAVAFPDCPKRGL